MKTVAKIHKNEVDENYTIYGAFHHGEGKLG